MANLKLIKVTGSPFSDTLYGYIGIQVTDNQFQIIKNGILNSQSSLSGFGWKYATAEEIKENWAAIYPHWTPEKGDNVIVIQNYGDWTNCKATIIGKDTTSQDYYRVERKDGNMSIFDYTSQMILAPYAEATVEPKQHSLDDFKLGDRVESIEISGPRAGKKGSVVHFHQGHVGVSFDEYVSGSDCNEHCPYGRGWYLQVTDVKHYIEPEEPKEETVSIRFLREQEFKDQGLWGYSNPIGWNSSGEMNKYLGKSVVIPKSSIGSDGSFQYEYWSFKGTDYIVTEGISSSVSTSKSVVTPIAKPEKPSRRFKVGDKVTYKSRAECNGSYNYGGEDQTGFVGIVESEMSYESDKGCYGLRVTTKGGDYCYNMLESEFKEYDSGYVAITSGAIGSSQPATRLVIKGSSAAADANGVFVSGVAYPIRLDSSDGSTHSTIATIDSDPLSSYKQKPITIKPKPKTKLTTI